MTAANVAGVLICVAGVSFCGYVAFIEARTSGYPSGWIVATVWALACLMDAVGDLA